MPPQLAALRRPEALSVNGYQFDVQIEAGIHLDTGEVYARFQSLNPTNGLPPPVEIGFLPPEDGTGRGQGHISYVIRPRSNLVTGTEIRNVAWIKFDVNDPIATDWVDPHDPGAGIDTNKQALVTIDADPPTSHVNPLPSISLTNVLVSWSGDDAAGAGVAFYDVFVSKDGGVYQAWLSGTAAIERDLPGRVWFNLPFLQRGHRQRGQPRGGTRYAGRRDTSLNEAAHRHSDGRGRPDTATEICRSDVRVE